MANYDSGFSYAVRTNDAVHWGIKGMKWYVRRFQNADGTLTPLGRKRYLDGAGRLTEKGQKDLDANAYAKSGGVKATAQKTIGPKIAPEPNGPRQMTKAQLQSASERAKLEQEYLKNKTASDRMLAKSTTKTERSSKKIADMTDIEFEEYVSRVVKEKELIAAQKDITQFKHDQLTQAERVMNKAARYINSGVKVANAVGEVYNVAAKAHNVKAGPDDVWKLFGKDDSGKKSGNDSGDNSGKKPENKPQTNESTSKKDRQNQQKEAAKAVTDLAQGLTYGFKKRKKK